ncbi:MAG: ABC transporter ATP-binding protein [Synergistales bacterium]|nr:ABC transporter ATP-binding protein [Synergistales bacterium]
MRGISKSFLGKLANDSIDFDVRPGEVHALLGENGAGKSTLMNVLCGLYHPDRGEIRINGTPHSFSHPKDAINAGIGMVHQHFMLVPVQTVWENLILGQESHPFLLRPHRIIRTIESLSRQYGLHVDPEAKIWQLSLGEQQRVAILKMLYRNAETLILDEPTAVLTPQETERLFATIQTMRSEEHGVIFITHKLDEVMRTADRVTILRGGRRVTTVDTGDTCQEELAELMVGKKVVPVVNRTSLPAGRSLLRAERITAWNDKDFPAVKELSLELKGNEILGIAGIDGNGQRELCEALAGLRPLRSGAVRFEGKDMTGRPARDFIDAGISYIPADRKGTGLIATMNLRENSVLRDYWNPPFARGIFINWEAVAGHTGSLVERYSVSAPSLDVPVRMLSGGNLQKLMLGRELTGTPRAIIAMQPTWGLDVGATTFVRETLLQQRERGAGILLISENLEELLALSDRLAVIHAGRIMGTVTDTSAVTEQQLGRMMAGTPISELNMERDVRDHAH